MRYFYDTEFLEDGSTIELISLGMVAEDGREFYGINQHAPWKRIAKHEWLCANVVPSLPKLHGDARLHYGRRGPLGIINWRDPAFMQPGVIAHGVLDLIGDDPDPQLWAYYGAYDHVVLCQLWGRMIDLPEGMPMWTHDLMQECERHGNPAMPEQPEGAHNALADARWVKHRFEWLQEQN